ncbi:helix-turn-helix domain-containing protein [Nonomuraea sp. NPDC004297]
MVEPSKVIDLRTRSTYQPDCAMLARNRLLLARNSLGLSHNEFADLLTPMVGWPVTPDAIEAWETTLVPPGDVLIAVSTVTPLTSDRLGIRSHKFVTAYIGKSAARHLAEQTASARDTDHTVLVDHPAGACRLHVWPYGVVIFHLVEELDLPNIAHLAVWRYQSYERDLNWAARQLGDLTGQDAAASYVLSFYWLHSPMWAGRMLDTALRIICAPRVLVDRDKAGSNTTLATAEQAERELLAEGFAHQEMRSFGLAGVSLGYASWSGVAYRPLDPARCLAEDEIIGCELATQAIWAYCEYINGQVEQGRDPTIADGYGWRFLRGARSRLTNPRPRETGQHRSMRDAIVETSGLTGHLDQAIEALRETGRP